MHATVFIKFGTMWFLYENETTKRRHVMPRSSAAVGCDVATFDLDCQISPYCPEGLTPQHYY